MAVTRRGYIFGAFLIGVFSVLLVLVSISSDSWVVSSATAVAQARDSALKYGLFRGELELNILATSIQYPLYVTCLSDINSCAVSCKTERQAREEEVRALANRFRTNTACTSVTTVDETNPLSEPAVISYTFYVCVILILFLHLASVVISASLAIVNATRNPTEPAFGLPGCLWSNVIASCLGTVVLLTFGIYWATSGLQNHLAFSYVAVGEFSPGPRLGYSYWLQIASVLCTLANVGLIQFRKYMLERDPPPPTIKVDNNSDGTIFLY